MKTETLSILEKVQNGELTPQVAQQQLFVLFGVSGSASSSPTLHEVGNVFDDVDCCKLCRYDQSCPKDVYDRCIKELAPKQYYR